MPNITIFDKLTCVVREVGYRKWVYPRRVAAGKMTQSQADREIAVMECIAEDYKKSSQMEEPELFSDDAA
jgi:hypothetical protein